jgi:O-methyltransferase involved in polyketide biosynthesis
MKYLGVDISEDYVARASSRKSEADRTYVVSDLSKPGWLNSVEYSNTPIVLAMGIFHHLDDGQMKSLLTQLSEGIPQGSKITSLDPTITSDTSKAAAFLANQDRGKFLRTPEEMHLLLDEFGFSTIIQKHKNQLRIPYDTLLVTSVKK